MGDWRRGRRRSRGYLAGQAVMFLGEEEADSEDDARRMKVLYTAVALAVVVLLTASYFG